MTIFQIRGVAVSESKFLDTGRTDGSYGYHNPAAGVDVEPSFDTPQVDVRTGEIEFENCEFSGNIGSQLNAAHANTTDDVTVKKSHFYKAPDSYFIVIALGVMKGEISDSIIDAGAGSVYPGINGAPPEAENALINDVIYSSVNGIISAPPQPTRVLVTGSKLVGMHLGYYNSFMPYIKNTLCEFSDNEIFIPKEAHKGDGKFQVISLLQNVALSSENHFTTDLVPIGNEHFVTSYLMATVVNDHYDSGTAFRPGVNSLFDTSMPYSQP